MDSFSEPESPVELANAPVAQGEEALPPPVFVEHPGWFSVFVLLAAGALTGLVVAWHILAASLLPHILKPAQGIEFQQVTSRIPVSRLLSWNLAAINRLIALRDLQGPALVPCAILIFAVLWVLFAQVLNPDFHPLRLHLPRKGGLLEGSFETDNPTRTLLAIVFTMLAFLVVYAIVPARVPNFGSVFLYPAHDTVTWLVRFLGWGVVLWVCLSPGGLMDILIHPGTPIRANRVVLSGLTGLGWGLAAFLPFRLFVPTSLETLLLRLQQLGPFNTLLFDEVTRNYVGLLTGVWLAAICWVIVFAPRSTVVQRSVAGVLAVVSIMICHLVARWFTPANITSRFNITPQTTDAVLFQYSSVHPATGVPDGVPAARLLASTLALHFLDSKSFPSRNLLVFRSHGRPVSLLLHGYTVDGLSASRRSTQQTAMYLQHKRYLSALAWVAVEHLFDCYTLRFKTSDALGVLMEDLTHGPFASECDPAALTMFFTCAANSKNARLLDEWADSRRFTHPDRFSRRLIGDLYRRFGEKDKALAWYKRAHMPTSFMVSRTKEQPMFHNGSVNGTLLMNGKPLAGARVGVMPWRLNGLPVSLAYELHGAIAEIYAMRPSSPIFGSFQPGPFALRWISEGTVTDGAGRFNLTDLTEGQYRLLVELPANFHLNIPFDRNLGVENGVAPFVLRYNSPTHGCGSIRLTYTQMGSPH